MRITSEVMVTRSLDRLQSRLAAYERAHSELGTGRKIISPSDDPAGSRRVMSLRSTLQANERFAANISDAVGWLDSADSQLQAASERMIRVRELATQGASNASANDRRALADEIEQIAQELAGIANSRHLDRPIFGGYTSGPAVELVDGVWQSNGDGDVVSRRVSDSELVQINVTASRWLGFDDGDDLLTLLDDLVADLRDGTPEDVNGKLDTLKAASDRIGGALATIGAATNRVDSARSRTDAQLLTLRTELSNVQDVDLAEGVMELQIQQVAYEATLQALAKALPPSLVAFLR